MKRRRVAPVDLSPLVLRMTYLSNGYADLLGVDTHTGDFRVYGRRVALNASLTCVALGAQAILPISANVSTVVSSPARARFPSQSEAIDLHIRIIENPPQG